MVVHYSMSYVLIFKCLESRDPYPNNAWESAFNKASAQCMNGSAQKP